MDSPSPRLRRRALDEVRGAARSRPVQVYLGVWAVAAVTLTAFGHDALSGLLLLAGVGALSLVTALVTAPARGLPGRVTTEPRLLVQQLVVVGATVVLTGVEGLRFHGVGGATTSLPAWTALVDALGGLGDRWFGAPHAVSNPVLYVAIPLVLLLWRGARPGELGLRRGIGTWRAAAVWCALPVVVLVGQMLGGRPVLGAGGLAVALLLATAQNGPMEEFLFRGALQTRLRLLAGPGWALVGQALVFGVWHLGLGYSNFGHPGGLVSALASTIVYQSVLGLAFGVLAERTGSLIAPSLFHVLYNTMFYG